MSPAIESMSPAIKKERPDQDRSGLPCTQQMRARLEHTAAYALNIRRAESFVRALNLVFDVFSIT